MANHQIAFALIDWLVIKGSSYQLHQQSKQILLANRMEAAAPPGGDIRRCPK